MTVDFNKPLEVREMTDDGPVWHKADVLETLNRDGEVAAVILFHDSQGQPVAEIVWESETFIRNATRVKELWALVMDHADGRINGVIFPSKEAAEKEFSYRWKPDGYRLVKVVRLYSRRIA